MHSRKYSTKECIQKSILLQILLGPFLDTLSHILSIKLEISGQTVVFQSLCDFINLKVRVFFPRWISIHLSNDIGLLSESRLPVFGYISLQWKEAFKMSKFCENNVNINSFLSMLCFLNVVNNDL